MSKTVLKIVNRNTGKEFTDIDHHLLSYAESDSSTFQIVYGEEIQDNKPEVFEIDDLKKMSMKSLKEVYSLMSELKGESMPKARKNSPTEIIQAILQAQEE